MQLIPAWAPNIHPMMVHFPIVLVMLAAAADVVHLVRPRPGATSRNATVLYVLGAVSALAVYWSGRSAASLVFIPGMAHGLVDDHESWALLTTGTFAAVAALRLGAQMARRTETRGARILFVALGLVLAVLVQQTAERGARLVYEQGVGVIPGAASGGGAGGTLDNDGGSIR